LTGFAGLLILVSNPQNPVNPVEKQDAFLKKYIFSIFLSEKGRGF